MAESLADISYERFLTLAFQQMVKSHKVIGHSLTEVTAALGLELITADRPNGLAVVKPVKGKTYYQFRYKDASIQNLGFTRIALPETIKQSI